MRSKYIKRRRVARLVPLWACALLLVCGQAAAQISANENATALEIETILEGASIDISNVTVVAGAGQQQGSFTGGTAAVGINQGVFVSTGRGNNFASAASVRSDVQNAGVTPDADLVAIRPSADRDTSALSLQITPQKNTIFARFAFASEEYPEYVCSQFNDAFALFISGGDLTGTTNMAIVPGSGTDVSINTVNNGLNNDGVVCAGETSNNSQLYNDNAGSTNFIFDGYTSVFEVVFTGVTPGVTYNFKMVVADAVDNIYDSAVFLEVFDSRWINFADLSLALTSSVVTPVVNEPFLITATVTNDGPDPVDVFHVQDILPDGLSIVSILGGVYDAATDTWTNFQTLPPGQFVSMSLSVMAADTNTYATTAEIVVQHANDTDSTPDNKATAPAEDDTASLSVGPIPTFSIAGFVAQDSGIGGGTAYNGVQDGAEIFLGNIDVRLKLASDLSIIAVTQTDGTGAFVLPLDQALIGQQLIVETATPGIYHAVSEAPGALPGLVNPSPSDGQIVFTPLVDENYTGLSFGKLLSPLLITDRTVTVPPGGAVSLAHKYTASGAGLVTFSLQNLVVSNPGIFSTSFFHDTNCSETLDSGEGVVTTGIPVLAGDDVCLLIRHVSSAGVQPGETVSYTLNAATQFTGITLATTNENGDLVTISNGGNAQLVKQVCNLTTGTCNLVTGTGFSTTNTGSPGDILQYRLSFQPTGADNVDTLDIFDATPAFSGLKAGSAVIVQPPVGMTCTTLVPSGGGAEGYRGNLQWQCGSGQMAPGEVGVVAFQVLIDQ